MDSTQSAVVLYLAVVTIIFILVVWNINRRRKAVEEWYEAAIAVKDKAIASYIRDNDSYKQQVLEDLETLGRLKETKEAVTENNDKLKQCIENLTTTNRDLLIDFKKIEQTNEDLVKNVRSSETTIKGLMETNSSLAKDFVAVSNENKMLKWTVNRFDVRTIYKDYVDENALQIAEALPKTSQKIIEMLPLPIGIPIRPKIMSSVMENAGFVKRRTVINNVKAIRWYNA